MRISASQIKTFELCQKKWFLEKIQKIPPGPPGYGATFGTVMHGCLERLQLGEEIYPEGWDERLRPGDSELVQDLLCLYKPMVDSVQVEKKFSVPVVEDITLTGYIDLLADSYVIDHKSTSSFKWALSAEELARDLQMMVYAYYALSQTSDKESLIKLQHNVFLRRSPAKRRTTVAYVSPDAILERWGEIKQTALKMKVVAGGECPPVAMGSQCHKYGGCPYAGLCSGVLTQGQLEKKMSSSSLEDKLKAIAAARRGGQAAPGPVAEARRRESAQVMAQARQEVGLPAETPVLLGDSDWEKEEVVELQRRTDAALEASKVLELKGLPPKSSMAEHLGVELREPPRVVQLQEAKPKRKRGRPRKKKVEAVEEAKAPEAKVKKTKVSVFIGVGPTARKGEFISMEDAFLAVVGNKQAFYRDKAFDRRDLLVEGVDNWGEALSKSVSVITSHPMTWGPDQKAFVWALRLRAAETGGVIVEGSL